MWHVWRNHRAVIRFTSKYEVIINWATVYTIYYYQSTGHMLQFDWQCDAQSLYKYYSPHVLRTANHPSHHGNMLWIDDRLRGGMQLHAANFEAKTTETTLQARACLHRPVHSADSYKPPQTYFSSKFPDRRMPHARFNHASTLHAIIMTIIAARTVYIANRNYG